MGSDCPTAGPARHEREAPPPVHPELIGFRYLRGQPVRVLRPGEGGKAEKLKPEDVIATLRASAGVMLPAAEKLGITRSAVW